MFDKGDIVSFDFWILAYYTNKGSGPKFLSNVSFLLDLLIKIKLNDLYKIMKFDGNI